MQNKHFHRKTPPNTAWQISMELIKQLSDTPYMKPEHCKLQNIILFAERLLHYVVHVFQLVYLMLDVFKL